MIELKKEDFMHLLQKVLFLESAEHYCNKDNWPPEAERSFMVSLTTGGCEASQKRLIDCAEQRNESVTRSNCRSNLGAS